MVKNHFSKLQLGKHKKTCSFPKNDKNWANICWHWWTFYEGTYFIIGFKEMGSNRRSFTNRTFIIRFKIIRMYVIVIDYHFNKNFRSKIFIEYKSYLGQLFHTGYKNNLSLIYEICLDINKTPLKNTVKCT